DLYPRRCSSRAWEHAFPAHVNVSVALRVVAGFQVSISGRFWVSTEDLVPHHGGADVVYPATFAVKPRVAIMNNGEKKGGSRDAFAHLRQVVGLEDVWQLHKSLAEGAQNYPDDHVANL